MARGGSTQILCSACGEETLLRREPLYEGFSKIGERLVCVSCGHVYGSEEEVPFHEAKRPKLFDEADRPQPVEIFSSSDDLRNCRHCVHYVVNPFVQRCSLHQREVESTDLCGQFEAATDGGKRKAEKPKDPLAGLFGE